MKTELTRDTAVHTLQLFFLEMNRWGRSAIEHHNSVQWGSTTEESLAQVRLQQRKELVTIFIEFCKVGEKATRFNDTANSFWIDEPEYNPEHSIVSEINDGECSTIVVNGRDFHYRYHLVRQGDSWWLLDKKEASGKKTEKWRRHIL